MNEFVGMFDSVQFSSVHFDGIVKLKPYNQTHTHIEFYVQKEFYVRERKKQSKLEKDDDPIGKKPYYNTNKHMA